MKKIVSLFLVAVMLVCSLAVTASADGVIYMDADFSSDASFSNTFFPEAYFSDGGKAVGYSGARALQAKNGWVAYDVVFDVNIDEDELYTGSDDRTVSFVYLNSQPMEQGLVEDRITISFCVNVTAGTACLVEGDFAAGPDSNIVAGPIDFAVENGTDYHFGVSVTEGRIRAFCDDKLLLEFVDTANAYHIGAPITIDDLDPDILLWWNTGNTLMYSDIKVASPAYFYPLANTPDVNTTAPSTTAPSTTRKEVVDVTDDKGNAVTDDKGNKVTEEIIITEPPVADTNTNAGVGGNSATTGDNAFIVVAVMVASLGCALIVRKIYNS